MSLSPECMNPSRRGARPSPPPDDVLALLLVCRYLNARSSRRFDAPPQVRRCRRSFELMTVSALPPFQQRGSVVVGCHLTGTPFLGQGTATHILLLEGRRQNIIGLPYHDAPPLGTRPRRSRLPASIVDCVIQTRLRSRTARGAHVFVAECLNGKLAQVCRVRVKLRRRNWATTSKLCTERSRAGCRRGRALGDCRKSSPGD